MAGTRAGGLAAARTNKAKYGKDFYKKIGSDGGKKGGTGGFYYMKVTGQVDKIREIGSRGGKISRRTKKV